MSMAFRDLPTSRLDEVAPCRSPDLSQDTKRGLSTVANC